jgi:CDGSH-type Zn-finger protein/uncharacterized Fe-S cluster protein YjdI
MEEDIHEYSGENITVTYDVKRCTHARACVEELPDVFDPNKRPWIEPDSAEVDELAAVVMDCPTGALQFERSDGGPPEPVPDENTVTVVPDGPLHLRGNIEIATSDGDVLLEDTRVALCRCGMSQNKPLCDNSHVEADFQADGRIVDDQSEADDETTDGVLRALPIPDGPLMLEGEFEVQGTDTESQFGETDTALCRCGRSANKPLCDGTHTGPETSSNGG